MNHMQARSSIIALTLVAVAGLGACSKDKDNYAAGSDTTAIKPDTTTAAAATPTPAPAPKGWSDGAIVAFVTAANNGEVQVGKLAEKKATNPAVKALARQMVKDHEAMQTEMKGLATKLAVTGDTTADAARDLMNDGRDELKDLTEKAAGADWDKNYIDKMIDGHQKVLDKLQDASKNTTNADLRGAIEKAVGKVQQHLTKAQDIKSKNLKA